MKKSQLQRLRIPLIAALILGSLFFPLSLMKPDFAKDLMSAKNGKQVAKIIAARVPAGMPKAEVLELLRANGFVMYERHDAPAKVQEIFSKIGIPYDANANPELISARLDIHPNLLSCVLPWHKSVFFSAQMSNGRVLKASGGSGYTSI